MLIVDELKIDSDDDGIIDLMDNYDNRLIDYEINYSAYADLEEDTKDLIYDYSEVKI